MDSRSPIWFNVNLSNKTIRLILINNLGFRSKSIYLNFKKLIYYFFLRLSKILPYDKLDINNCWNKSWITLNLSILSYYLLYLII